MKHIHGNAQKITSGNRYFLCGPSVSAKVSEKFHVALYASHAALPMVISKFSSNAAR
jgi:hypothetical protein